MVAVPVGMVVVGMVLVGTGATLAPASPVRVCARVGESCGQAQAMSEGVGEGISEEEAAEAVLVR